jgi:hypothetical protein
MPRSTSELEQSVIADGDTRGIGPEAVVHVAEEPVVFDLEQELAVDQAAEVRTGRFEAVRVPVATRRPVVVVWRSSSLSVTGNPGGPMLPRCGQGATDSVAAGRRMAWQYGWAIDARQGHRVARVLPWYRDR